MKRHLFVALAFALTSSPVAAESLTTDMIIALTQAQLGDDAIIAKIKETGTKFELSTEQMISLKNKGVSGPVIAAMISSASSSEAANAAMSSDSPDPKVAHPSGIYLLASWLKEPKMQRIDPTVSNQTKTSGFFSYALTAGIAPVGLNTVLPNPEARMRAPLGKPTFYFYFDEANRSLSQGGGIGLWGAGPASAVTSPGEFSLVRFSKKKNQREAKVGQFNIAGAKSGVMDKDRISFDFEQITPGVFKVAPTSELPEGEYGFLYSTSTGAGGVGIYGGGATTARIFDFAVTK